MSHLSHITPYIGMDGVCLLVALDVPLVTHNLVYLYGYCMSPGAHCCDYYPCTLSFSKVSETHLRLRHNDNSPRH